MLEFVADFVDQFGLCDANIPVTLLAVPDQRRTSQLSLQYNRYLAIHHLMDATILRCCPSGRCGLRSADPVEELEGDMDGATGVRSHWR